MKKTLKLFLYILIWITWIMWISQAFDLVISEISLSNGGDTVALNSKPSINIIIKNIWNNVAIGSWISEGFIKCINSSWSEVFKSSIIKNFILNTGESITVENLKLSDRLTLVQREVAIECSVNKNWAQNNYFIAHNEANTNNNSTGFSFRVDKVSRFDSAMNRAIKPIRSHLDAAEPNSPEWGWESIKNFVFNKIVNVITPIIIILGIVIWIIGAYKLFFSDKEEETKKWIMLIVYWVIGIVIILSARYIWKVIFDDMLWSWDTASLSGVDLAQTLYEKIAYPFIKIILYLVLWVLFVVLAGKTLWFVTKSDWSGQKKAATMIARSAISILVIIWAKQLVEAVYWKQTDVLNKSAQNLWEIGGWILADKSIPILYTVINRIMWLTSLVVLIIIIFQTFQILVNPDKTENRQRISKTILYIFIWILIIWTWYVLTNFLVIN